MSSHPEDDWVAAWMREAEGTPRIENDAMLARLRRGMFSANDAEVRVGKYRQLEEIGRGGMSIVYRARDEALDRDVVIKVLHHHTSAHDRRLRREATAMASLSHPHVVQVLEVGREAGETFVVMELVQGRDAARWLAEAPRPWSQVLAVFLQAGEGLAAVHEAGLVHRDFKPSNVLVGDDGRTRVADFGLASLTAHDPPSPPAVASAALDPQRGSTTVTGATVGTPRYMAPEQHEGARVDARADQWSFAASLWEALYGRHPLADDDGAIDPGRRVAPPPSRGAVPTKIGRVLSRALAVDPASRYRSMTELVARLRQAAAPRPHRRAWVTAGAVGLTGVFTWWWTEPTPPPSRCDPSEHSQTLWSPEQRAIVEQAFAATELPYAARAYGGVDERVRTWLDAWNGTYRLTCESATHEPSRDVDVRLACLRGTLIELRGLLDTLAQADRETVTAAEPSTRDLPALDRCTAAHDLSIDSAIRMAHEDRMSQVRARFRAGRYGEAATLAERAVEATDAATLLADAGIELGRARKANGELEPALQALRSAYYSAASARDASLSARSALHMLALSIERGEHDQAEDWIRHARTWIERVDGDRDALQRDLALQLASLRQDQNRLDESLAQAQQAWTQCGEDPSDPIAPELFNLMGVIHTERGDLDQAEYWLRRAHAEQQARVGDGHPWLAQPMTNLGRVHSERGDYPRAERVMREALKITVAALGPTHPENASIMLNLGLMLDQAERLEPAEHQLQQAVDLLSDTLGPDHLETAHALNVLAATQWKLHDWERSVQTSQRALAIYETQLGPDHPRVIESLGTLARSTAELGRPRDALPLYERQRAALAKLQDDTHRLHALVSLDEAAVRRFLGELPRADQLGREALEDLQTMDPPNESLLQAAYISLMLTAVEDERHADTVAYAEQARVVGPKTPLEQGIVAWSLARGLVGTGGDRSRVRSLLDEAREHFGGAGPHGEAQLAELEAWVADAGLCAGCRGQQRDVRR